MAKEEIASFEEEQDGEGAQPIPTAVPTKEEPKEKLSLFEKAKQAKEKTVNWCKANPGKTFVGGAIAGGLALIGASALIEKYSGGRMSSCNILEEEEEDNDEE